MPENDYEYRKQLQAEQRKNWEQKNVSGNVPNAVKLPNNNARAAKEAESTNVVNMNDYKNSLKADQNKSAAMRGKGGIKNKKINKKELQRIVDNYKKAHFKIILIIAIISDIGDGLWLTGVVFKPLILYFFHNQGNEGKAKVKDFMRKMKILTWFDFIPVVDVLPLTTFAVLMTWHIKKKECDAAKSQLASGGEEQEDSEDEESEEDGQDNQEEDQDYAKAA